MPKDNPESLIILVDTENEKTLGRLRKMREKGELQFNSPQSYTKTQGQNGEIHITTKTPRKRPLEKTRGSVRLLFSSSDQAKVERLEIMISKAVPTPIPFESPKKSLANIPVTEKVNRVTIKATDLAKPLPKHRSKSQNDVMGRSAAEELSKYLKQAPSPIAAEIKKNLPDRNLHWGHRLAHCLVEPVANPQTPDNLMVNSDATNYSAKKIEVGLRKGLKNNEFDTLDLENKVQLIPDTHIATAYALNIGLTKGDKSVSFNWELDSFLPKTETSDSSKAVLKIAKVLTSSEVETPSTPPSAIQSGHSLFCPRKSIKRKILPDQAEDLPATKKLKY